MISNLEYYRSCLYTANLLSFTRAAELLYVTQSAVSQSIKKLENELGYPLFIRSGKELQLTTEGEHLLVYVRRAMEELSAGERIVSNQYLGRQTELTIGATETAIRYYLATGIRSFKSIHPDVQIIFQGTTTQELCRLLKEGAIELAFLISPIPKDYDFSLVPLRTFQDIPIAAGDFDIDALKTYSQRELADYPLIAVSSDNQARANIDAWFLEDGHILSPSYTVRSVSLALPLVRSGLGIGMVPLEFVTEDLQKGDLIQIRTRSLPEKRTLYAATQKGLPISPIASAFMEAVPDGKKEIP